MVKLIRVLRILFLSFWGRGGSWRGQRRGGGCSRERVGVNCGERRRAHHVFVRIWDKVSDLLKKVLLPLGRKSRGWQVDGAASTSDSSLLGGGVSSPQHHNKL